MRRILLVCLVVFLTALSGVAMPAAAEAPHFRTAIYVVVYSTQELADRATFERQYARVAGQLKFDKVYIESYRDHVFATDEQIEKVKAYFREKGVAVAGGITLAAGGKGGQFGTFDYEDPADRAECRRAAEQAAKHFDEVILDDFFFYTSKSDADIAAKGTRSWTQYRLDTMRQAAADLVVGPAKAVHPSVRMVIKYPNWYEHFQGLGFDLEKESHIFAGLYTGTETRDPILTDQLLQQYESYEIFRYYRNIRPDVGGNGGGWVDTGSLRSVDRYREQLRDTVLAKAPEVTLFNWFDMIGPAPDERRHYGLDPAAEKSWLDPRAYAAFRASYRPTPAGYADQDAPGPGWARAAGFALADIDAVAGALGQPVGIAAYKPYQSAGEDFLQNYLGNIGLPIEMMPQFPAHADLVLLTESAAADPDIIAKIKRQLQSGGNVVVTSGFLKATQDKGFKDIAEWEWTGRKAAVGEFLNGFGAGNGESLNDPDARPDPVLLPEIRFFTNDSWAIIRGIAGAKGYPILLSNAYSKGTIFLLTIPDNPADLYRLPQALLTQVKTYLQPAARVRLQGPALTSLFVYDNGAFATVNYRDTAATVTLSVAGKAVGLRDLKTGRMVAAKPAVPVTGWQRALPASERTQFDVVLAAHGYGAYRIEE